MVRLSGSYWSWHFECYTASFRQATRSKVHVSLFIVPWFSVYNVFLRTVIGVFRSLLLLLPLVRKVRWKVYFKRYIAYTWKHIIFISAIKECVGGCNTKRVWMQPFWILLSNPAAAWHMNSWFEKKYIFLSYRAGNLSPVRTMSKATSACTWISTAP